jgi:hypothetical protein
MSIVPILNSPLSRQIVPENSALAALVLRFTASVLRIMVFKLDIRGNGCRIFPYGWRFRMEVNEWLGYERGIGRRLFSDDLISFARLSNKMIEFEYLGLFISDR